ncbi:AAA family ATPase [Streptomyces sp. V4-01]|uniref:AAA family ATPase n=1 Tax=Actinacidiphila polyblastidii TaxID=3110430 RepID=A0ABU7PP21_9ACTN|nr:AAA family ATPase [Streptomyces sp. V4-01]
MNDREPTVRPSAHRLVGRDADLACVASFFSDDDARGRALLLCGDAGVGRTAFLDAVAADAEADGVRILRARGVRFEKNISYAGLNQLLVEAFDDFDVLEATQRDALRAAVGIGSGPAPGRLVICTAVLLLLRRLSARTPLLLVVDDLQWLDEATDAVLGFVARRLVGSRVGLLAASGEGPVGSFKSGVLPEHLLEPLDDASSVRLVARRHPDVCPAVRRRIVAEARGNPLALVELPSALSAEQRRTLTAVPAVLPLTRRLQSVHAPQVAELPASVRELMLIAALDRTGEVTSVEAVATSRACLDDLAVAARARLVTISPDGRRLEFRSPLIRSAAVGLAGASERRRIHRALANVLEDRSELRAWHLGHAAVGPDETVAGLLEDAAHRRLRQGDALGAVAALTRSAALSPVTADRGRRLAEAAYVGADAAGVLEEASRLLAQADLVDPASGRHSLHAAAASAFLLINDDGDVTTAYRLLVGSIEAGGHGFHASDTALVEALYTLVLVCWYGGDPALWRPLNAFVARLTPEPPELLSVLVQTFADPAHTEAPALSRLATLIAAAGDDPTDVVRAGAALIYLDRLGDIRWATRRLVEQGRSGTAPVRRYLGALTHLGLDQFHLGRWEDATKAADEGLAVCEEHHYPFYAWFFQYIKAVVAAARGEVETTAYLTEGIVRWATPRGVHGACFHAGHARGLSALGSGDFETAYQQAGTLSAAGTLAPYVPVALWSAVDLVEAAVRTGRDREAADHAAAMRASAMGELSPRLEMLVLACEALTTPGEEALDMFERALSLPGLESWPFDLARVCLFHGERLRRLRATAESRSQLSRALEIFERLGARRWAARAAGELRASGQSALSGVRTGRVWLTAQEMQIAALAATGLTNKQIAERLFLSHRTVGTHLYQIYPKLGITSRAALRDALAGLDASEPD